MSLVIDVNWASFKQFLRQDGTFFYIESNMQFLLVKPFNNYFLRTYVIKDGSPRDFLFKENELISRGAMPVISFNFNEKQVVREVVLDTKKDEVNQDNEEVSDVELDLPVDVMKEKKDNIVIDGVNVVTNEVEDDDFVEGDD